MAWLAANGETLAGLAFGFTGWVALTLFVVCMGTWGFASVLNESHKLMHELRQRQREAFLERMKEADRLLK